MAKRRKSAKKFPVCYISSAGEIQYVGRTRAELPRELERVRNSIHAALRILFRLRRVRHKVIVTATFQLRNCLREIPESDDPYWVASEIARLSYIMEDTRKIIDRLKNSRTHWLEQVRFTLTYGQTPKQRDPAGSYGGGTHGRGKKEVNGSDNTEER